MTLHHEMYSYVLFYFSISERKGFSSRIKLGEKKTELLEIIEWNHAAFELTRKWELCSFGVRKV